MNQLVNDYVKFFWINWQNYENFRIRTYSPVVKLDFVLCSENMKNVK